MAAQGVRRTAGAAEPERSFSGPGTRVAAAGAVLLALVAAPVPLLPPHSVALTVQSALGSAWPTAFFVTAASTQILFYGALGVLAALALKRVHSLRGQLLQIALLPWLVTGAAVLVRSLRIGHVPLLANAIVPATACLAGVALALGFIYGTWKAALAAAVLAAAAIVWLWATSPSAELAAATGKQLRRLIAAGHTTLKGDRRFGALLETAFAPLPEAQEHDAPVDHNRAALLALGIALGDERLAPLAGLEPDSALLSEAAALREGTTLRGREDWARHYSLSAELAVLRHPLVSDAAGVMKEQLDALAQGSGFSFADLAADRAGVRLAVAALESDAAARSLQARLQRGYAVADFFPPVDDLPENLTPEAFRRDYGTAGSARYRTMTAEIEARLDASAALSAHGAGRSHP